MKAEYLRDAAMTGVIFGFATLVWFGWAQEAPPASARKWLGIGSGLGALLMIGAGLVAWKHWNDGSAIDEVTGPRFGIIVGVEFLVAGVGAGILAARKRSQFIAPWIAFVVGVHFIPLATLIKVPLLFGTGVLVALGAWASARIAASRGLTVSFVTGVITGSLVLVSGVISLLQALS